MRKITLLVISLFLALMLFSCQNQSNDNPETTGPETEKAPITETTAPETTEKTPPSTTVPETSPNNTTGSQETEAPKKSEASPDPINYTTYVYTAQGFLPVSHIENEQQIISGGKGMSELYNLLPKSETLSEIDTSSMYTNNNVPNNYCYNSHETIMNKIMSNGDWDFFPTKVQYKKYSLKNQPDRTDWKQYFQKKLDEISPNTPIIFEEAYFFDWDKNGTQYVIVNIGNAFEKAISTDFFEGYSLPDKPTPPPSDQTVFYQMSAIFIYQENQMYVYDLLNRVRTSSSLGDIAPYVPPQTNENNYSLDYYTVQYDSENNIIICPVYANHITWESFHTYTYNYTYLLCDIDGNGKSELIIHWPVHYGRLEVFQSNDSKIEKVATISTIS